MAIPKNITKEHIEDAINEIIISEIPKEKLSYNYYLVYHDKSLMDILDMLTPVMHDTDPPRNLAHQFMMTRQFYLFFLRLSPFNSIL